jgi:hypothetical protein
MGSCRWFGNDVDVPIICMDWLEGAREIHVVSDPGAPGCGCIAVVDEFCPEVARPGLFVGRTLDAAESDAVWSAIAAARTRQAEIDPGAGLIRAHAVEINHGDYVLRDSGDVALVATSRERQVLPLGAWLYEIALSSARDEESARAARLRWNRAGAALAALRGALARRDSSGELAWRMVVEAADISSATLADTLGLRRDDELAWRIATETQQLAETSAAR